MEFVLDDGTTLGAHADGGVRVRPIDYCKPSRDERFRIPVTFEQKEKILTFVHEQCGKPYDFLAIAGILFHRDWRKSNRWFCSELVAAAFEAVGHPIVNAPNGKVNRISPRDCYLSPFLIGNQIKN